MIYELYLYHYMACNYTYEPYYTGSLLMHIVFGKSLKAIAKLMASVLVCSASYPSASSPFLKEKK